MKTSPVGRKLIEDFEGYIGYAYDDYNDHIVKPGESVRGTLTIGYGHTDAAGYPKVFVGQQMSKVLGDQVLSNDLASVEHYVNEYVKVPINQNQFDALVSFHFNTGALGHSSVLRNLNASNYSGAADALLLYNKASGRVLRGLVRRRKAERTLFLSPVTKPVVTPKLPWYLRLIIFILKIIIKLLPTSKGNKMNLTLVLSSLVQALGILPTIVSAIQHLLTSNEVTTLEQAFMSIISHLTPGQPNSPTLSAPAKP